MSVRIRQALGLHHHTVQRCVERAVVEGPMAALDDRPRPGREPTITVEAKAWLVSLACRKAKDLGYPSDRNDGTRSAAQTRPACNLRTRPRIQAPRHGQLAAGIDLLTGKVRALVRDRHRSREFIEFLKLLDAA